MSQNSSTPTTTATAQPEMTTPPDYPPVVADQEWFTALAGTIVAEVGPLLYDDLKAEIMWRFIAAVERDEVLIPLDCGPQELPA
jgi:hypothetical protein